MDFQEFREKYEHKKVEEYPNRVVDNPVVSVSVLTYQHAPYIKECLEGILMQQTDFPFEVLVGEDDSSDGTREICLEYAKKHPDKIRLFLHHRENNIKHKGVPTAQFNSVYNGYSLRGKYIAVCEGDDFWTDPLKLQKQVEFMDKNEDCSACFHPIYEVLYGRDKKDCVVGPKIDEDHVFSSEEIIKGIFIRTVSMLYRSDIVKDIPNYISKLPFGDFPFQLFCASKGNIGYLGGRVMSVYRRGVPGSWSELERSKDKKKRRKWDIKRYKDHMLILDMFNAYTNNRFDKEIRYRKRKVTRKFLVSSARFFLGEKTYHFLKMISGKNKDKL